MADKFAVHFPTQKPLAMQPKIALLACSVFEREIEMLAEGSPHLVETRFYEIALHDRPDLLRANLQAEIDEVDARDDIDAIVLAYGLCGLGTAGLRATHHPLVFPRAHDCITVFLGSKEAYSGHQKRCPTCYYYTPGWNRARRVPGPDRVVAMKKELSQKFDEDDVEFLIESEQATWAMHDTATYIDLGTDDAKPEAEYAQQCADSLGWKFEHIHGDSNLLRDLLWGNWDDERFQTIAPGSMLGHSPDDKVMRSECPTT